jgi:HTH-type transcriptional regulator / antitoxin HigA
MLLSLRPIKTEEEYQVALQEIDLLFDVPSETAEADRLEILVTLVEAYEVKHCPMPLPDPIEAILYYLEARGLSRQDLEPWLGGRDLVGAVLNRQVSLSLEMIRRLNHGLGIPADVLIQSYELVQQVA